jgi:DNA-binding LacI/PurR family transcriptional regulator
MRQHRSIPLDTRQRVEARAAKMGYRPDPMLRSLLAYSARNTADVKSATLALVVLHSQFSAWGEALSGRRYLDGIRKRAQQLGYGVEIFCPAELAKEGKELNQILRARGIRGVVLVSPVHATISRVLEWENFATAKIGYAMELPQVHRVLHHFRFAMKQSIAELRRRGYRRFGLAYAPEHEERLEDGWTGGFLIEQYKAKKGERFFFYRQRLPTGQAYYWRECEHFKAWYERHQPEVVLSAMGWAPLFMRKVLKLRIPEDVGFVDLAWPVDLKGFAGIDERLEEVGAAAVDLVSSMLHNSEYGMPEVPKTVVIGGRWVEGGSVRSVEGDE